MLFSAASNCLALAGARQFRESAGHIHLENATHAFYSLEDLSPGEDGVYRTPEGQPVSLALDFPLEHLLYGKTLRFYVETYGEKVFDLSTWPELLRRMDGDGLVPLTDESLEAFLTLTTGNPNWGDRRENVPSYLGNVHSWESEADSLLWRLTVSPLVDLGLASDGSGGAENAWIFEMAESVEDVTAEWPQAADWGVSPEETGRVWRIRLRQGACWDDEKQTPIDADAYLSSMKLLLSQEMMNYRASAFCEGPMAIAGANAYRYSGADYWEENALAEGGFASPPEEWTVDGDGRSRTADGTELCFALRAPLRVWLDGSSLEDYYRAGYVPENVYTGLLALGDEEGFVPVTTESADLLYSFTGSDDWGRETREDLAYYTVCRRTWPATDWSRVGLLREDAHTLIYVCAESIGRFDFLFGLTTPWLVYEPLYESEKFTYEDRVYTGGEEAQ